MMTNDYDYRQDLHNLALFDEMIECIVNKNLSTARDVCSVDGHSWEVVFRNPFAAICSCSMCGATTTITADYINRNFEEAE